MEALEAIENSCIALRAACGFGPGNLLDRTRFGFRCKVIPGQPLRTYRHSNTGESWVTGPGLARLGHDTCGTLRRAISADSIVFGRCLRGRGCRVTTGGPDVNPAELACSISWMAWHDLVQFQISYALKIAGSSLQHVISDCAVQYRDLRISFGGRAPNA